MELKIIPKDTVVYRSYNDDSKRDGYWYALQKNDILGYGNKLGEYRTTKELQLIDITHKNFYNILKDSLTNMAQYNPELNYIAHMILYPLGFDDTVFYRSFTESIGINPSSYSLLPRAHTDSILYFNGRSRLSIHNYDVEFMKHLNTVFGSIYDGIVSEKQFPDIIRNGFQCAEISIFDKTYVQFMKEIPRPIIGGTVESSVLPPIDTSKLTSYYWDSVKLADKILNTIDTSQFKMPDIVIHQSLLTTPITKYNERNTTRKHTQNNSKRTTRRRTELTRTSNSIHQDQ